MSTTKARPLRCLSIDVEDYFHIEAAHRHIAVTQWDRWPLHVTRNVEMLLELLADHAITGTFFVLGWVAKRLPDLVPRIANGGHEIASHGYNHQRLHRMTPDLLRCDLNDSKHLLEDQAGAAVIGYRAPTFSLVRQTAWAVDVLAQTGYHYDASIFPVRHHWYGVPDAPTSPFYLQGQPHGQTLLEVPALTWRWLGRHWPVAGGGYFRLLPLKLMEQGLAQAARTKRPAVLYFHPWEFDPLLPRMPLGCLSRLRTYTGLKRAKARLQHILNQPAQWQTLATMQPHLQQLAARQPTFCLTGQTHHQPQLTRSS